MYRIFCVDDEPGLLEICKLFLENDGMFTIDAALTDVGALDRRDPAQYDAIVSDYQMPEMNGITFLRKLLSLAADARGVPGTGGPGPVHGTRPAYDI